MHVTATYARGRSALHHVLHHVLPRTTAVVSVDYRITRVRVKYYALSLSVSVCCLYAAATTAAAVRWPLLLVLLLV